MTDTVGMIIKQRYVIDQQISEGGMSVIFRGTDKLTGHDIVIKALKPDMADYLPMFEQEARVLFKIRHENIVKVYDYGCVDGFHYMIMEFVNGETLKDMIERMGRIPSPQALRLGINIIKALEIAHNHGIIHRDIKPQNILISSKGKVKLADFGIAADALAVSQTGAAQDNGVIGSVLYFSPEQARGEYTDFRTDIYSFGIMLYEMVTGNPPFVGDSSVSVAIKHLHGQMDLPDADFDDIPQSVADIIRKSTQKDPQFRYETAAQMEKDMKYALVVPHGAFVEIEEPEIAPARHIEYELPRRRKRMTMKTALIVLAGLLAFAGMFTALFLFSQKSFHSDTETVSAALGDYHGLPLEDAAGDLMNKSIPYKLDYMESDSVPDGSVISQSPEPGASVIGEEAAQLMISLGPKTVSVPSLLGRREEEIQDVLMKCGLILGKISYDISEYPEGEVYMQDPAEDTLSPVGDKVDVYISVSNVSLSMPDLYNMAAGDAGAMLANKGLRTPIVFEESSDKQEPGTVIRQSPEAGSTLNPETSIKLCIVKRSDREFSAQIPLKLELPADGTVMITMMEDDGLEYWISQMELSKGKHEFPLQAWSSSGTSKDIIIYLNGDEYDTMIIDFTRETAQEPRT